MTAVLSFDEQRRVSIDFIRNSGGLAVRVNEHEKTPARGWQPKLNDPTNSELILREATKHEYTENLGIHLFGALIDVDVDSDSPSLIAALEKFLPPCNHVWGHASRPRTHRVYQLRQDFDPAKVSILSSLKRIPEVKIELRGGPQGHGQYCVVPGSVHPTNEVYEWADLKAAKTSLVVVDLEDILKAVRLSGAIAVLAPYWTQGIRNQLTMALSGFLYRTYLIADTLGDVDFKVDKDLALKFVQVLLEVTGDTGEDYNSRRKTFEATWKKAEQELPVTGGTSIQKLTGDSFILTKLYSLLCDSPDITLLDEFMARFCVWNGPGLVIDLEAVVAGAKRPYMNHEQFTKSFGHQFIESGGHRKLAAEVIYHLPTTLHVEGITFEPGEELITKKKKVNQWRGFEVQPWPEVVIEAEIHPFTNYLFEVIAGSDIELYEWVMGWLANIFQEPESKVGTALVLVGLPGVGKSFLGQYFIVPMIGEAHAKTTSVVDRLTSGFNALFDNCIYVQCDEAVSNRQRQTAARLKSLITDRTVLIEPKGVDPFEKPNHMRLLFTSNEVNDAIFLTDGIHDRRYTIIEVPNIKKGQITEYWAPLAKWAGSTENLSKVHRFLLDYKYDRSVIGTPLRTEAKINMQEHSMPGFDRWLYSWTTRGHPLSEQAHLHWYDAPVNESKEIDRSRWPERINYSALALDLEMANRLDLLKVGKLNEAQIRRELRKRNLNVDVPESTYLKVREFGQKLGQFTTQRIRLYAIPTKQEIRNYLLDKYGRKEEDESDTEPMKMNDDDEEF